MSLSPFRPVPRWQKASRASAVVFSVLFHVGLGVAAAANPTAVKKATEWVEVAIHEPPKPPPPPPEPPKPEPPKPKTPPKAVKFEEILPPDTPPPPDQPAPPPERVVRRVQGLSANSFGTTGAGGFQVKSGNTVATKASSDTLDPADVGAWESRPYTAVAVAPKLKWNPTALEVPEEAKQAKVEGTVVVKLDIDGAGKVVRVVVVSDLGFGTGAACADAWRKSNWKPAEQDGQAVAVLGVPQKCTVQIEE